MKELPTYVSRLTLTILAGAGITLFAGVLFYFGAFSVPPSPQGKLAAINQPTLGGHLKTGQL